MKSKLNKNAFTVVELIVSFSLALVIAVFLFQIIINLKRLYDNSVLKTELVNIQSLVSREINNNLSEKKLYSIIKCGAYCLNFIYDDATSDKLVLEDTSIEFGSYKTNLPKGYYFKNSSVNIANSGTFQDEFNDSILIISLPIYSNNEQNEVLEIQIIYQFNEKDTNIYSVSFDSNASEYGYIYLKGSNEIDLLYGTSYIEPGYEVLDSEGKVIEDATVVISNPLQDSTNKTPQKYKITYSLYVDNRIVNQVERTINLYMDFLLNNIVKNGGFESNTDWILSNASYVTNEKFFGNQSLKLNANVSAMSTQATTYKPIYGHKYYGRLMFKSSDNFSAVDARYELRYSDVHGGSLIVVQKTTKSLDWVLLSNIITLPNDNYINQTWGFRNFTVNATSDSYVDNLLFIDLTETFGVGNEPSKEWCDENIPFFEGQYNLVINK